MPTFIRRALPLLSSAALALAVPAAACAVDAPSRFFAVTPSGEQAYSPSVFGISPDGNEVLMSITASRTDITPVAAIRNLTANTTARILPPGSFIQGASIDLQRVLYSTTARVDPARDTNSDYDYYVYNRSTRDSTLVSRTLAGVSAYQANTNVTPVLMGDGRSVLYNTIAPDPAGIVRLDIDTGEITRISADKLLYGQRFDTAGRVIVTETGGILVDGRSIPDPGASSFQTTKYWTSPDGGTVVIRPYGGDVQTLNTATGVARSVATPTAPSLANGFNIVRAENGGQTAIVFSIVYSGSTHTNLLSRVNFTTGSVTQLGGNLPDAPSTDLPVPFTEDLSFTASTLFVSALGTKSIPGAAQPIPEINPAEYVSFTPGCSYFSIYAGTVRAAFTLRPASIGVDTRTPRSAVVKVISNATGLVTNQFTLAAPKARAPITPATGDLTARVTVTFTDGKTSTGFRTIPAYTPTKNDTKPFDIRLSICQSINL